MPVVRPVKTVTEAVFVAVTIYAGMLEVPSHERMLESVALNFELARPTR